MMSNLKMGEDCASGIELTTIRVKGSGNHIADTWWEYDVSEQFPIKSANETHGSVNIEVDKPQMKRMVLLISRWTNHMKGV